MTTAKSASALNDNEKSANDYFALSCALGYHKLHVLVATVRCSSKQLRLDDVDESSLSKEFSDQFFMDTYCVWY